MNAILFFVLKDFKKNILITLLTIFVISLSVCLILLITGLHQSSKKSFMLKNINLNAVIGAKSSATQLVMNTFFHMDSSPGNIPYNMYEKIKKIPGVEIAIPYVLGDNYHGYRIIGTSKEIFQHKILKTKKLIVEHGREFNANEFEIVIGNHVALQLGLKLGDKISSFHGIGGKEHQQKFTVVGILESTRTPYDQILLISLRGFYNLKGHSSSDHHAHEHHDEMINHDDEFDKKELSAIVLKVDPLIALNLIKNINSKNKLATFAYLPVVIPRIMEKLGWGILVLKYVAYLVLVITGIIIFVGIYSSLEQRKKEFAILRALGGSKKFILFRILFESELLVLLGTIIGFIFYKLFFILLSNYLYSKTGVFLEESINVNTYIYLPLFLICIGFFAGILPGIKLYKSNVNNML
ncbi:MAG: hypothetical protein COA79_11645 [Planctomycetota bacterium]|nr:MAG: hypothetical protein COA79_11645 [Planctomycetota bacterium]